MIISLVVWNAGLTENCWWNGDHVFKLLISEVIKLKGQTHVFVYRQQQAANLRAKSKHLIKRGIIKSGFEKFVWIYLSHKACNDRGVFKTNVWELLSVNSMSITTMSLSSCLPWEWGRLFSMTRCAVKQLRYMYKLTALSKCLKKIQLSDVSSLYFLISLKCMKQ